MSDRLDQRLPAPPPSAALAAAVASMRPVRPRVPLRALAAILGVGLVWPIIAIVSGQRQDLPYLPVSWVAIMALAWLGGVVGPLVAAILPRRGEVLVDTARAGLVAAACAAALVLLGLFATVDVPETDLPRSFIRGWWHCVSFGLEVAAPVLLVGAVLLRRHHPVGSWKVAAALGAAGGALGGLTLHFVCGLGGGLHVGFGHAGAVVLGALAGALLLGRALRG